MMSCRGREETPVKKKDSLSFILLISLMTLMTVVIGITGCASAEKAPQEKAEYFTTVPEITGGRTGFNEDGLHYSDGTLQEIVDYILQH